MDRYDRSLSEDPAVEAGRREVRAFRARCDRVAEAIGVGESEKLATELRIVSMADTVKRLQEEVDRITEGVRYWSYCTNAGMREEVPEEAARLADFLISLKITPYYLPSKG